jgi:PAS domain S-box-containing protein
VWESSADAIAVFDVCGVVLAANPAYFQFYGLSPADVRGQHVCVIHPADPPALREQARARYAATFVAPEVVTTHAAWLRLRDSSERHVQSRISFLLDGDHGERGRPDDGGEQRMAMVPVVRDLTDHKRAAAQVATA